MIQGRGVLNCLHRGKPGSHELLFIYNDFIIHLFGSKAVYITVESSSKSMLRLFTGGDCLWWTEAANVQVTTGIPVVNCNLSFEKVTYKISKLNKALIQEI